jgi:hypothetical protein
MRQLVARSVRADRAIFESRQLGTVGTSPWILRLKRPDPARATRDKSGQTQSVLGGGKLSARIFFLHVSNIDDKSDKTPAPHLSSPGTLTTVGRDIRPAITN